MVFVEHAVIKNQVTIRTDHDFLFALLPDLVGFDPISLQVACWCVVTEALAVLGKIRERPKPVRCCCMGQEACNWFGSRVGIGSSRFG